jgi:hypothetical protein
VPGRRIQIVGNKMLSCKPEGMRAYESIEEKLDQYLALICAPAGHTTNGASGIGRASSRWAWPRRADRPLRRGVARARSGRTGAQQVLNDDFTVFVDVPGGGKASR